MHIKIWSSLNLMVFLINHTPCLTIGLTNIICSNIVTTTLHCPGISCPVLRATVRLKLVQANNTFAVQNVPCVNFRC